MAIVEFKIKPERRQAMLSVKDIMPSQLAEGRFYEFEVSRVPVLVWPMPTKDGLFVVEHQDGTVRRVQPDLLTFIGSKELFDQYIWEEARAW